MTRNLVLVKKDADAEVPATNEALVAACAVGDAAALGTLFDRLASDVTRFLGRLIGPGAPDLEDLVQQTFIEVMRAAPRFNAQASARTWVLAIAGNLSRNHIRGRIRRRRWLSALADLPENSPRSPATIVETNQQLDLLENAIGQLKHDLRVPFILCDVEGVPGPDVSRALGIRPGTLWRRLHDARVLLRAAMEER